MFGVHKIQFTALNQNLTNEYYFAKLKIGFKNLKITTTKTHPALYCVLCIKQMVPHGTAKNINFPKIKKNAGKRERASERANESQSHTSHLFFTYMKCTQVNKQSNENIS
jgi:hypothetical protein